VCVILAGNVSTFDFLSTEGTLGGHQQRLESAVINKSPDVPVETRERELAVQISPFGAGGIGLCGIRMFRDLSVLDSIMVVKRRDAVA
jgi:hypothetical protein